MVLSNGPVYKLSQLVLANGELRDYPGCFGLLAEGVVDLEEQPQDDPGREIERSGSKELEIKYLANEGQNDNEVERWLAGSLV